MYDNADEEPFDRPIQSRRQQTQENGSGDREGLQQDVKIEESEYNIGHVLVHILH